MNHANFKKSFSRALFYTCHTLSQEAMEVCFTRNTFQFLGIPSDTMHRQHFLGQVPMSWLRKIREIDIVFRAFPDYSHHKVGNYFEPLLDFVSEHLDLEKLSLCLTVTKESETAPGPVQSWELASISTAFPILPAWIVAKLRAMNCREVQIKVVPRHFWDERRRDLDLVSVSQATESHVTNGAKGISMPLDMTR